MSAPAVSPPRSRGRKIEYSARDRAEAIRLYQGGWTQAEIVRLFRRRGYPISANTVSIWVNPAAADRQLRGQRERNRVRRAQEASMAYPGIRSAAWRLARMQVLAAARLSSESIARVMSIDFPEQPLSRHQVDYALRTGRMPTQSRRDAA